VARHGLCAWLALLLTVCAVTNSAPTATCCRAVQPASPPDCTSMWGVSPIRCTMTDIHTPDCSPSMLLRHAKMPKGTGAVPPHDPCSACAFWSTAHLSISRGLELDIGDERHTYLQLCMLKCASRCICSEVCVTIELVAVCTCLIESLSVMQPSLFTSTDGPHALASDSHSAPRE
jgi:hypothetical protein